MGVKIIYTSILVSILGFFAYQLRYSPTFAVYKELAVDVFLQKIVGLRPVSHFGQNITVSENGESLQLNLAMIDMTEAKVDTKKAATKVYEALSEVGFAYLVNVPGFKPDKLLELTKWFFELPLEIKMQIAKKAFRESNKNAYRGYYPVIPGGHSFKEAFEVGAFFNGSLERRMAPGTNRPLMRDLVQEGNVWPNSGDKTKDAEFVDFMKELYGFYTSVGKEVMHLMAEGLGLEIDHFDSMYGPDQLATLRLLHYPTRINDSNVPDEAKDGDTLITTGEHFDTAFLTILATFDNKGLQVKLDEDEPWLDVPPIKDGLVVNVGALLTKMVNEKFKATNHRVIDLGTDRYSVPFFFEPAFDADISKAVNGDIINTVYPKYGPWMTNRTSQFKEYATTDFGIAD